MSNKANYKNLKMNQLLLLATILVVILPKLNAIILLVILQVSITLQYCSFSFSAADSFQVPFGFCHIL